MTSGFCELVGSEQKPVKRQCWQQAISGFGFLALEGLGLLLRAMGCWGDDVFCLLCGLFGEV